MDKSDSTFELREGTPADAAAISALTTVLTSRWIASDCTPEGATTLLASMAPEATEARLRDGHRYLLAWRGDALVAVAALRLPAHLFHLFVVEDAQRQGLARRLWMALQAQLDPAVPVTVNASRHALAVYRRLGFEATAQERCDNGIVFTPMVWRPTP